MRRRRRRRGHPHNDGLPLVPDARSGAAARVDVEDGTNGEFGGVGGVRGDGYTAARAISDDGACHHPPHRPETGRSKVIGLDNIKIRPPNLIRL